MLRQEPVNLSWDSCRSEAGERPFEMRPRETVEVNLINEGNFVNRTAGYSLNHSITYDWFPACSSRWKRDDFP